MRYVCSYRVTVLQGDLCATALSYMYFSKIVSWRYVEGYNPTTQGTKTSLVVCITPPEMRIRTSMAVFLCAQLGSVLTND